MFTGLIEDVGTLSGRRAEGRAGKLEIKTALPVDQIAIGDSIAVNGACLTVEQRHETTGTIVFHTLAETLQRTNLGDLPAGSPVNLERALRVGDRLGGHFVLGHVDCTARIVALGQSQDDVVVTIELPDALRPLLIPKGSIGVDGISLTVADLQTNTFSVHLIPETMRSTNLVHAGPGTIVNLEGDMLGKYALRYQALAAQSGVLTVDTLRKAGFLE